MDISEKMQGLLDRHEVSECVHRHARGQDRHDIELMTSCYHPEAVDDHGRYVSSGQAYAEQANKVHQRFICNQHHITTQTIEVAGDTAHAESYFIAILRDEFGSVRLASGRYIDRLERKDGDWRISVRVVTVESALNVDGVAENDLVVYHPSKRNRQDLSYQRPLTPPRQSAQERFPTVSDI